eukprot:gb/GECG01001284.1/.p1 GENE.gb/GECG01001284.1/~~gb/GECG01001284.1/.p1  ORF type:complete len:358 (+),score=49.41 gb/GECG01001284.1/:1-1074(+)
MISKLIAHGEDRPTALRRLQEALKEYEVVGLSNNIEFLRKCASHPDFVQGGVTTNFLNTKLEEVLPEKIPVPPRAAAVAAFCRFLRNQFDSLAAADNTKDPFSPWAMGDGSRPNGTMRFPTVFHDNNVAVEEKEAEGKKLPKGGARGNCHVEILPQDSRSGDTSFLGHGAAGVHYKVRVSTGLKRAAELGDEHEGTMSEFDICGQVGQEPNQYRVTINDQTLDAKLVETENEIALYTGGISLGDVPEGADAATFRSDDSCKYFLSTPTVDFLSETMASSAPQVTTPMPGKVIKVLVNEGDLVEEGQAVIILEAMKMEHVIKSPINGKVANIRFSETQQVADGEVLAIFENVTEEETK